VEHRIKLGFIACHKDVKFALVRFSFPSIYPAFMYAKDVNNKKGEKPVS